MFCEYQSLNFTQFCLTMELLFYWIYFVVLFRVANHTAKAESQAPTVLDTDDGIWAISPREGRIYLVNRDFTDVSNDEWRDTFAETDVTFDPVRGLLFYCISGDNYECLLHKTSLDQCYDEHFFTLEMEYVYGMGLNIDSRLLYMASFEVPSIYEINVDTGQWRVLFEFDDENISNLQLSADKRFLYWFAHDFDNPNRIRRGDADGSGTPTTLFSRPQTITCMVNAANRFYFNQENNVFSTDINGNDEQLLFTEASRVWEMTLDNGYLYWGNDAGQFRRLRLAGNPSSNTIETLTTITNMRLINHHLIAAAEIEISRSVLAFTKTAFTANENEQSLSIEVSRTGNLFRCSCVDVIVTTGSRRLARATIETTLNFAVQDDSETYTITWTDDNAPDESDHVTVQLLVASDDKLGQPNTADVIIRDDDCGYFFADSAVSVNEDDKFVNLVIKRVCTGDSLVTFSQTISVEAIESDGSARAGTDFVTGTMKVTFSAGTDSALLRIRLVDNVQPEETERFEVRLVIPNNGLLFEPNSAAVTIIDYDYVYILTQDTYYVLESNGSLDIVIRRIGNTTLPGSVRVAARGQDADLLEDFSIDFRHEVINFDRGVSEVVVPISITDDGMLETNETFEVFLHSPGGGSLGERKQALVSIIDDEAEVALSSSSFSCLESRECSVEIVRTGFLDQITTIHVQTEDSTAYAGIDFTAVDEHLTFNPWVTSLLVKIQLTNDEIKEPHANFRVYVNDVTSGIIGEPRRANVALWDDDTELPPLVYSLDRISYSVRESDKLVEIEISRGGSYLGQLGSVRVQAFPTAEDSANIDDFVNPDLVVEFKEGQSSQILPVTIKNDDIIENPETFAVQLLDVVNGALGEVTQATVTIQDDDSSFYLDKKTYHVNEMWLEVEIIVHRDGYLEETGYVTLQIVDGSALIYDDYIFPPRRKQLHFAPNQTTETVVIEIVDDSITEETERMDVILSEPQYGTLGSNVIAAVLIEDNDIVIESSTGVSPSQPRQQIGTTAVVLIVVGITAILIVSVSFCALCAVVIYRRPPTSWLFPLPPPRQITAQPHSTTFKTTNQNPYSNVGHVVRRLSGRVVRRLSNRLYQSPYTRRARAPLHRQTARTLDHHNQLVLYGTTNPVFEGDLYGQESYIDHQSVLNRPRYGHQLALPQESSYTNHQSVLNGPRFGHQLALPQGPSRSGYHY